jgi:hypothetical protein
MFTDVLIHGEQVLVSQGQTATIRVSAKWLNGPWLVQDSSVFDLPKFDGSVYQCFGDTPLYGQSLEALGDLQERVGVVRERGDSARGHMVWFSDGDATDDKNISFVETLPLIIQRLHNPLTQKGERGNRVFDFFAIPIGEKARAFYEGIGIPGEHITEVSSVMGAAFKDAMLRSSLKILEAAGAIPDDVNVSPSSVGVLPDQEPIEANGDAILRIMREKRAQLKSSQPSRQWPSC